MFKHEAREWLEGENDLVLDGLQTFTDSDDELGRSLVEDLYKAGAVKVEVITGDEDDVISWTLHVTLPQDKQDAIAVLVLIASKHCTSCEQVDEPDVVRLVWESEF